MEDCNIDAGYQGEFFKCAEGACIESKSLVCSGSKNCKGGEDETVEICLEVFKEIGDWIPGYEGDVYAPKADSLFPCPTKAGQLILADLVSFHGRKKIVQTLISLRSAMG